MMTWQSTIIDDSGMEDMVTHRLFSDPDGVHYRAFDSKGRRLEARDLPLSLRDGFQRLVKLKEQAGGTIMYRVFGAESEQDDTVFAFALTFPAQKPLGEPGAGAYGTVLEAIEAHQPSWAQAQMPSEGGAVDPSVLSRLSKLGADNLRALLAEIEAVSS